VGNGEYYIDRTWSVTDSAGNRSEATSRYTVHPPTTTAPTLSTPTLSATVPNHLRPSDAPLCLHFESYSAAGIRDIDINVLTGFVNGRGKFVNKQFSAVWGVDGNTLCIYDSGGIGCTWKITVTVTDNNGGTTSKEYQIDVIK
jgi:hypothetical protein